MSEPRESDRLRSSEDGSKAPLISAITTNALKWTSGLMLSCALLVQYQVFGYLTHLIFDQYHYGFGILVAVATYSEIVFLIIYSFQAGLCLLPMIVLQAASTSMLLRRPEIKHVVLILILTSLSALGTALLFDYVVPAFRWYSDDSPDWVHGLTLYRFAVAFLVHIIILLATFALSLTGPAISRLRQFG